MLLLDGEGLSAIAHGPTATRDKVRALITVIRSRELPVGTVAAVLAEVVRGRPADAGLFAGVRRERVEVYPVETRVGVRAGQLLGKIRGGSEMAIDALIVAVADLAGGAIIATTDPKDLKRLAAYAERVLIADIQ
jgi:predicted nucleic acid-binding protein